MPQISLRNRMDQRALSTELENDKDHASEYRRDAEPRTKGHGGFFYGHPS